MNLIERITRNPAVMSGKPCIRDLRVTVSTVLTLVSEGCGVDEILRLYPYLEAEDVSAALRFAAMVTSDYEVELLPA